MGRVLVSQMTNRPVRVRVRVLKEFGRNWHTWRVGDEFEPDPVYRDILLRKGYVEVIEDVKIETASMTTKKRRRKRKARSRVQ